MKDKIKILIKQYKNEIQKAKNKPFSNRCGSDSGYIYGLGIAIEDLKKLLNHYQRNI
jgi:hypothetical protein